MWDFSSLTRDWTHIPWIAMQILNHWTTREIPKEDSSDWKSSIFFQKKTFCSGNQKTMSIRHDWIQVFTWRGEGSINYSTIFFTMLLSSSSGFSQNGYGNDQQELQGLLTSRVTFRKWKCLKKNYISYRKIPGLILTVLNKATYLPPYQFPNSAQVCLAMWITCPPWEPEDEVSSMVSIWAENG